jgi:hypothetical protein
LAIFVSSTGCGPVCCSLFQPPITPFSLQCGDACGAAVFRRADLRLPRGLGVDVHSRWRTPGGMARAARARLDFAHPIYDIDSETVMPSII